MVGKKSGRALLREEGMSTPNTPFRGFYPHHTQVSDQTMDADGHIGLERTDNNMDLTIWPVVNMINQKNYYT